MRPTRTTMPAADDLGAMIAVLRRGLIAADLDCECHERAKAVLDRFGSEHERQTRVAALSDARQMRDGIVIVLTLAGEIDELGPDEPDTSVFGEIASLFDDIGDFAACAAAALRRAAGRVRPRTKGG